MRHRWKLVSALLGALLFAVAGFSYLALVGPPSLLEKFDRLRPGMSKAEVEKLMGPPIGSAEVDSRHDGPNAAEVVFWGHYRDSGECRVAFDAAGKLLGKWYSPPYGLYDSLFSR